jgi:hypothetical protein
MVDSPGALHAAAAAPVQCTSRVHHTPLKSRRKVPAADLSRIDFACILAICESPPSASWQKNKLLPLH